jgi:putative addiction module component (TIGR02574 family)
MKPVSNEFPAGWDEARVRDVIEHSENQTEDEAVAEHEAALSQPQRAALAYTGGMTRDDIQRTALKLPPEDRRELVDALWESLESDPEPLPEWQRRLLDERLAALETTPDEGSTWDEVEKRVWADEE